MAERIKKGMRHNRVLVSKTNVNDQRERAFVDVVNGRPEPVTTDPTLEWIGIDQDEAPISSTEKELIKERLSTQKEKDDVERDIISYDDKTKRLRTKFAKVKGKLKITYEEENLR